MLGAISENLLQKDNHELCHAEHTLLTCDSATSRGCIFDQHQQSWAMLTETDHKMLRIAYDEAKAGFDEGGCPIGSVLARGGKVVAQGRNQRVQGGDPIAHGEMDALRKAGRQKTYRDTVLYTSLSPCMMCTGTIIQFGIPRVVIGENQTFGGNEDLLRSRGVEVVIANDPDCIALMTRFIEDKPELWNEDIAVD
jgi:cytosine/creatinine deaminase